MTLDEKRALHARWNVAREAFLSNRDQQQEHRLHGEMMELDRKCREVFGPVIPTSA